LGLTKRDIKVTHIAGNVDFDFARADHCLTLLSRLIPCDGRFDFFHRGEVGLSGPVELGKALSRRGPLHNAHGPEISRAKSHFANPERDPAAPRDLG
jgi:hypothetical protein